MSEIFIKPVSDTKVHGYALIAIDVTWAHNDAPMYDLYVEPLIGHSGVDFTTRLYEEIEINLTQMFGEKSMETWWVALSEAKVMTFMSVDESHRAWLLDNFTRIVTWLKLSWSAE